MGSASPAAGGYRADRHRCEPGHLMWWPQCLFGASPRCPDPV